MTIGEDLSANERRYARLNALWPQPLPALSEQEAISAAKRLYRLASGRAFKGTFRITSGNRRTWIRQGVFVVNPAHGWKNLVHAVSHLAHYKCHPGKSGHHWTHLDYERRLTEAVLSKGWLDGALRRAAPVAVDKRLIAQQRIIARIAAWETKQRRATTALAKLQRQKAALDKALRQT
jgi:hypothetical protein